MTTDKKSFHRVLYLTYDGLSDHIGQSQILPYLIASKKKGVDIGIISFEKSSKQHKVKQLQPMLESEGIEWHQITFSEGGNFSKLTDFLKFVAVAFRIARKGNYPVIHCRSYFASSLGLLLKKVLGKKLIFDKRDFWIDAKIETGRIDLSKFSHRLIHSCLRAFERKLFLQSDHIISLTERAKQIILQRYPSRKAADISVIPCCVDLELFNKNLVSASDVKPLKERMGLSESYVFGYVGSIGPAYMIPQLLQCFKILRQEIKSAKLLLLVNNDKDEVHQIAREQNLDTNDIIVASAPRQEMPYYISAMDCCLYFIMPSHAKQAASPTKLSEMLAMGKYVITNKGVGDVEAIFNELNCGYLLSSFSEDSYRSAAHWVGQKNTAEVNFDLSRYSLKYGADQYENVYQSLLGPL